MNQIILASHGELAKGMLQTVSMLIGDTQNIYAFGSYREEQSIAVKVRAQLHTFDSTDDIYLLTDIFGGSVNNEMLEILNEFPNVTLLTGMNLMLVIGIASQTNKIGQDTLATIVSESQNGVVNCNKLMEEKMGMEMDDL